jgi:hypothetical protein
VDYVSWSNLGTAVIGRAPKDDVLHLGTFAFTQLRVPKFRGTSEKLRIEIVLQSQVAITLL